MNWEALNEALIFRRRLELLIKYRRAVPGIMQAHRHYHSCIAMGAVRWYLLQRSFNHIPTEILEKMLNQADNEIDHRLSKHFFALPI